MISKEIPCSFATDAGGQPGLHPERRGRSDAITVEISSPTEGAAFTVGQEVYVVASVIAEKGVSKGLSERQRPDDWY